MVQLLTNSFLHGKICCRGWKLHWTILVPGGWAAHNKLQLLRKGYIILYYMTSTRNIMENIPFFSNFRFGQTLFTGALITELQLLILLVRFLYYYLIYWSSIARTIGALAHGGSSAARPVLRWNSGLFCTHIKDGRKLWLALTHLPSIVHRPLLGINLGTRQAQLVTIILLADWCCQRNTTT